MANTTASRFIVFSIGTVRTPGADSPTKTSAPSMTSASEPRSSLGFVWSAYHCFMKFMFSVRPR